MNKEQQAIEAHERRQMFLDLVGDDKKNFIARALLLQKGLEKKDHKVLGYDRVEDYWNHDLKIKPSMGWKLVGIAQDLIPLCLKLELIPDMTDLFKIRPLIRGKQQTEELERWLEDLFHKAIELSPKDFDKELRVARGKPDQDICQHESRETWERCKTCGKWVGKAT